MLFLRVPIGLALATIGWVGTWLVTGNFNAAFKMMTTATYFSIADFSLVVVPLFIMMGAFATSGKISDGAFVALRTWLGRIPSSLNIATIWGCVGFGAASGSSIATTTIFGKTSLPAMRKAGYNLNHACASIATAGIIAMMIPPSVVAVFYALFAEQSVSKVLMAGAIPGVVLAICLTIGVSVQAWRNSSIAPPDPIIHSRREKLCSLIGLWPSAVLILIVLGGIYSGTFSPTEAGAVGTFGALVIALINGGLTWKVVKEAALETARFTAILLIIFMGANFFARFLTVCGFTTAMGELVANSGLSATGMVIAMMLTYLLFGCFIDSVSAMAITLPMVLRPLMQLGVDPIHFGALSVLCLSIGKITPPFGMDVFAVKAVAGSDITLEGIFRACIPFIIMCLVALAIIIFFPQIALYLPRKME